MFVISATKCGQGGRTHVNAANISRSDASNSLIAAGLNENGEMGNSTSACFSEGVGRIGEVSELLLKAAGDNSSMQERKKQVLHSPRKWETMKRQKGIFLR